MNEFIFECFFLPNFFCFIITQFIIANPFEIKQKQKQIFTLWIPFTFFMLIQYQYARQIVWWSNLLMVLRKTAKHCYTHTLSLSFFFLSIILEWTMNWILIWFIGSIFTLWKLPENEQQPSHYIHKYYIQRVYSFESFVWCLIWLDFFSTLHVNRPACFNIIRLSIPEILFYFIFFSRIIFGSSFLSIFFCLYMFDPTRIQLALCIYHQIKAPPFWCFYLPNFDKLLQNMCVFWG